MIPSLRKLYGSKFLENLKVWIRIFIMVPQICDITLTISRVTCTWQIHLRSKTTMK
ncbi:hypothetical protein AHAS_Ahas11G0228100 [Arachis hypogaea]